MANDVYQLVTRIFDIYGSSALQELSWISGVKDELIRIKETLIVINAVLLDAQDQQLTSNSASLWLQNLKLVAYDIEDVLDLIATQDLELKVNGRTLFRNISRLFRDYDVAQELKKIRCRLDEIEYNRRSFDFQERVGEITVQRESYSYVRDSDVIGREKERDDVCSCVTSSSIDCLTVVPIIGIGGLGKTTLAKMVFNDPRIVSRFDLRLWAHVSSKFVLKTLLANILRIATGLNFSNSNLEQLMSKFCEVLGGKTYFLVLDDVWIRDPKEWMELKELLFIGSANSRIIVTTREERVAAICSTTEAYKLKGLQDDHCWSIFAKYAFNKDDQEAYPLLVKIGKSIVQKCYGVPLAAKTLGSVLSHERDDRSWKKIEESDLWKIEQGPNDILPALKVSYDQTPSYLRSCFTYCATYRKGHAMIRNDLVNMWMALGYLNSRENEEDFEEVGYRYFYELLSRSFLQFPGYDVAKNHIVMYADLFDESSLWNDLVVITKSDLNLIDNLSLVSQTFFQPVEKISFLEMHDLVYDLAAYLSKDETSILTCSSKVISPRSYYILWDQEDLSRKDFPIKEASKARVFAFLHPMGYVNKSFLKGLISTCSCLRILNLNFAEFEELPNSIGDLKHLRYLNLVRNLKLRVLPQSTCKLVNLQSIELFSCIRLEGLPKDIQKLVNLRYLSLTSRTISLPKSCLYGLSSLRVLRLWFCRHLTSLSSEIRGLKNLRRLNIHSCGSITTLPNEMNHLSQLEELTIQCCRSLDLKRWEGLRGLTSLRYLDLRELPKLLVFPEGIEFCGDSLRYFRITRCEGIKALPEGLGNCTLLLNLSLSICSSLTALPRSLVALRDLRQVNIDGCPEISRRCKKDVGSDWHLISHVAEIRIDHQLIQNNASLSSKG